MLLTGCTARRDAVWLAGKTGVLCISADLSEFPIFIEVM